MKKVSVLILCYNKAAYIMEAVFSVLNQNGISGGNLEIVIVNDGSTDNSGEVIEGLISEYPGVIKLVELKNNSGMMPAAMEGIRHLTGEYVCQLDADDVWKEGKLAEVIPFIEEGNDLVLHEGEFITKSGSRLRPSKCLVRDEDIAKNIRTFNGGVPLGSCVSFRRSSLDTGLLDTVYNNFKAKGLERHLHHDPSIVHNILSRKDARVKCVRKDLYKYRMHGENDSQHSDFDDLDRLAKTYKGWLTNVLFAVELYKLSGLFYEDRSIEVGFQKFLYHKNFTFREKPLLKLWEDYFLLLRNNAFSSGNEKMREAVYPFFYRLPVRLRSFIRRWM